MRPHFLADALHTTRQFGSCLVHLNHATGVSRPDDGTARKTTQRPKPGRQAPQKRLKNGERAGKKQRTEGGRWSRAWAGNQRALARDAHDAALLVAHSHTTHLCVK